MFRLLTLPARCFIEFLRGMADGPGAPIPHDPFPRKPETRRPDADTQWRAGALPMKNAGRWRRG